MAVGHANLILSWEENLSDDEMPPRWMWHLPWELKRHMKRVTAAREAKLNRGNNGDAPEGESWEADDEDIKAFIAEHGAG